MSYLKLVARIEVNPQKLKEQAYVLRVLFWKPSANAQYCGVVPKKR